MMHEIDLILMRREAVRLLVDSTPELGMPTDTDVLAFELMPDTIRDISAAVTVARMIDQSTALNGFEAQIREAVAAPGSFEPKLWLARMVRHLCAVSDERMHTALEIVERATRRTQPVVEFPGAPGYIPTTPFVLPSGEN